MLTGAIIGAIVGMLVVVIFSMMRTNRYKAILQSAAGKPIEYSMEAFYANPTRYKKAWKIYDSYGALYISGPTAYYQGGKDQEPVAFRLADCTIAREPDWRNLKWLSITTHIGEKYYFTSYKMGFFVNNSNEVLNAINKLQQKKAALTAS